MITRPKGRANSKHWFKSMSTNMQRAYVRKHPKTRMRATAGSTRTAPNGVLTGEWAATHKSKLHKYTKYYVEKVGVDKARARRAAHHVMRVAHANRNIRRHTDMAAKHKEGSRWHKYHMAKVKRHSALAKRHSAKVSKVLNPNLH